MSKTISGIPWGSSGEATSISGGAAGEVVYQNGSSSTAFTNAANGVLQSDGTTPVFSALSLSGSRVAGILPLTRGGTGSDTLTGVTGTGNIVANNTPTLITPVLGAALATSVTTANMALTASQVSYVGTAGTVIPFSAQSSAGSTIYTNYSDTVTNVAMGLDSTGAAFVLTSTAAADFIVFTNNIEQFRVKSGGVVKIPGYISSRALSTDASGNITTPTINGTGNLVGTTSAALVTPNIGLAGGTSLTLTGLTADASFIRPNGSKTLTSIVAPKLQAWLGTNQAVSGATVLNIDNIEIDTTSAFNVSTYKYTPQVAGYYAASAYCETLAVAAIVQVTVLKNGADVVAVGGSRSGAGAGTFATGCSGFTEMNGTTDYLEMLCYSASATTAISGVNSTCFNVYMIP